MIALPAGVTIYAGAQSFTGEIPKELCPEHLKPAASAPAVKQGKGPAQPADEGTGG